MQGEANHWKAYNELLARSAALEPGIGKESLQTFADVVRPLSDATGSRIPHNARIGGTENELSQRILPFPYSIDGPLLNSEEQIVEDVPPRVVDLSDGTVFSNGNVLVDDILSVDEFRFCLTTWRQHGFYNLDIDTIGFHNYDPTQGTCSVRFPPCNVLNDFDDKREYFLFNSNSGNINFGHFIHDTMSQLQHYNWICETRGKKLVPLFTTPHEHTKLLAFPMQRYIFKHLVGPVEDVFFLRKGYVKCKHLYSCRTPMVSVSNPAKFSFGSFRYIRDCLTTLARDSVGENTQRLRRVYISRRDATRLGRKFANIDQLEDLLKSFQFEEVVPGEWEPQMLAAALSETEIFIGIHGAGMLNPFFSANRPKIIELIDNQWSWQSIMNTSVAVGHPHKRVLPLSRSSHESGLPLFDINGISRAIQDAVSS